MLEAMGNMLDIIVIDRDAIPVEEHAAAQDIWMKLADLTGAILEYRNTLSLLNFALSRMQQAVDSKDRNALKERRMIGSWASIAGRNGALVAYGFRARIREIRKIAEDAPTIWANMDHTAREAADELFGRHFGKIIQVRNVAAHPGEMTSSTEEKRGHPLRKRYLDTNFDVDLGTYLEGVLSVEAGVATYVSSYQGKPVSYELSEQTARVLEEVAALNKAMFHPLETVRDREIRLWMAEMDRRHGPAADRA